MNGCLLGEIQLYVTRGKESTKLLSVDGRVIQEQVDQLSCDHEEADTRLTLHAAHAPSRAAKPFSSSLQTLHDVFILALRSWSDPKHLCCDYTSSFYGKDKAKALKSVRANEQFLSAFSDLGTSEVVCEETVVNKLNVFTCRLFGDQTATTVNDARYSLFTKGNFGEDYVYISPNIDAPDFCNHGFDGWQVDDGEVRVHWLFCLPAMDNIIESSSCNCKTGCKNKRCKCKKEDLSCTEIRGCTECENQQSAEAADCDDVYNDVESDDSDVE
ncbi:Hypothetical predicted protein [Paramuricea clavata]|uniref:Uncharacterized protein n=1 Tax=Paramuricea clavata TaxID=317549 RepID=A0A6S7JAA9_PARCT|nr:Hypothetical predicted protein [Paramuricea clavata]